MMMGMGFGVGLILMVLFWLMVIGLAIFLLSNLFPKANDSIESQEREPSKSVLEILKQRYARGELSDTEFKKMREVLQTNKR